MQSSQSAIDLSIIIVSYNVCDLLRDCLHSIYQQNMTITFEIIVVDNASEDNSVAMVDAEFPEVNLIANEDNIGFAGGNNLGLKQVRGRDIVLVNPDTIVEDNTLQNLVEYLDEHPSVGAVAPCVFFPDGSYQKVTTGYLHSPTRDFVHAFRLDVIFPFLQGRYLANRDYQLTEIEVEWISGVCFMIRQEIFETLGGLDTSYFMYLEDVEFCVRIRQNGWKIMFLPTTSIKHYQGASSQKGQISSVNRSFESLDFFYKKYYSHRQIVAMYFWGGIGYLLRAGLYKLLSQVKNKNSYRPKASNALTASYLSWQKFIATLTNPTH